MQSEMRFRTPRLRAKHFEEHGDEVGATDEIQYEEMAIAFMTKELMGTVLEGHRLADGARIRYNYITQEFGIVSADNYIQTYFRPDPRFHGASTNRAYFEWECNKR